MNIPHKYAKEIKAFADGATIQHRKLSQGPDWKDWTNPHMIPTFSDEYEWRVKPETLPFRCFLSNSGSPYVCVVHDHGDGKAEAEKRTERLGHFVRWVTPWQEVEV